LLLLEPLVVGLGPNVYNIMHQYTRHGMWPMRTNIEIDDVLMRQAQKASGHATKKQTARDVEALLRRFEIVSMAGDAIAVAGARNFRFLRRRGITVRKIIDLLIGTWCIENRASLLNNDSDFHPMTRHLGLREFIGRER
jgi:predicted nucleic acid-binding protein